MDDREIILQSIDICIKQIKFSEFGLKEALDTNYIVDTLNKNIHIIENYKEISEENKSKLETLYFKMGIHNR